MADSKSASAKNGIITHMNKDHSDSLIRYLEYYHKLSGWRAYNAKMTDIELDNLKVRASGQTYTIPFHPPMNSFSEARHRLVDMDKLAALHLRKSDVTIKRFVPPYGLYAIGFVLTVGGFAVLSQRHLFEAGGVVEQLAGPQFGPRLAALLHHAQPRIFYGLIAVHIAEMFYFIRYKLVEHSVSIRAPQFWLWAISVLIEGIGAQARFKRTVELARIEKEKQRH
ncbi:hypothetical protein AMS68_003277 [Peltaster fructicola]|uniref:DUF2470 domain-containing protein n=1 Tax=Peltaster fructicola TaxID=286661 RepID=A0A6H0XTH8_9PEZI|nr:hypothetical protein AMS68_003277 [Peltaster fructicola]